MLLFVGAHVLLFRKAGPAGPPHEDPITPKLPREPFYPRQVLFDMGFALMIVAALAALAYFRPVTLGPLANPSDSHFLPRPEWYYLPMFEWLKFWEGPAVVVGIVLIPGLVAGGLFLMPFLDRRLERKIWRRPIPALAVAIVVSGMVYLGAKSQIDDRSSPTAQQLSQQQEDEKAYSATPFEPYTDGAEPGSAAVPVAVADPLATRGKGIFDDRGCSACHGDNGTGTALAPSLVGITRKLPTDRIVSLLHNPTARMKAGGMPAVDASSEEMKALLAYLGSLGTRVQNSSAMLPSSQQRPYEEFINHDHQPKYKGTIPGKQNSLTASISLRAFP
jgi:ubiquinol-cytochrome c reductase cytochrome b subunit